MNRSYDSAGQATNDQPVRGPAPRLGGKVTDEAGQGPLPGTLS
jgi:hypothetical protein